MSDTPELDARRAIEQTERALDAEPDSALALAIQGHALCHLSKDGAGALQRIDHALALNPNESLAWLYKSVWSTMWGSSTGAVLEAEAACALSPIDPVGYYYDMVRAAALSAHGEHDQAIELAQRSVRSNRHHQPTLRVLLHAQFEAGRLEDARATLGRLQALAPGLTVSRYLGMGAADSRIRQRMADVLRQLGVPEK